jgi:hypothetical protein
MRFNPSDQSLRGLVFFCKKHSILHSRWPRQHVGIMSAIHKNVLAMHESASILQIISGRFFSGGKINEGEADAILYSNFSWITPINTGVAELRPADTYGSRIASYVLRYTNRYELPPLTGNEQAILVLPHTNEAIEQFRLLASFYFQSFFHVDRNYVELLCGTKPVHSFDTFVPSAFVPKFFEAAKQGTQPQAHEFVPFVQKVLAMPRKQYRFLMSCLAAFFDALEVIGDNFDLAYSLVVYMLEALS